MDYNKQLEGMSPSIVTNINMLVEITSGIAREKGFHDVSNGFIHDAALVITEVAEAIEGFRRGTKPDEHVPELSNVEIELADAVIRIFDMAGRYKLNLGDAIVKKSCYNTTRPYLHGKTC